MLNLPTSLTNAYIVKYIPEFIIIETRIIRTAVNIEETTLEQQEIIIEYNTLQNDLTTSPTPIETVPYELSEELSSSFIAENGEIAELDILPIRPQNEQFISQTSFLSVEKPEVQKQKQPSICPSQKNIETPCVCDLCGKIFSKRKHLSAHLRRHNKDKWRTCKICGKKMPDGMNRHMRTHTGDKPYQCDICQRRFCQISMLHSHKQIHTDTGEEIYKCRYCDMKFARNNQMKYHQRLHRSTRNFVDPQCTVPDEYSCDICGKISKNISNHKAHLKTHTDERPFQCNVCLAKFKTRAVLVEHIRIHTGERPFVCGVCNKTFSSSSGRNEHLRIHTGIRNHECVECKKRFLTLRKMRQHMLTHTGEKPYQCKICEKRFTWNGSLTVHLKNLHEIEKNISYANKTACVQVSC